MINNLSKARSAEKKKDSIFSFMDMDDSELSEVILSEGNIRKEVIKSTGCSSKMEKFSQSKITANFFIVLWKTSIYQV